MSDTETTKDTLEKEEPVPVKKSSSKKALSSSGEVKSLRKSSNRNKTPKDENSEESNHGKEPAPVKKARSKKKSKHHHQHKEATKDMSMLEKKQQEDLEERYGSIRCSRVLASTFPESPALAGLLFAFFHGHIHYCCLMCNLGNACPS